MKCDPTADRSGTILWNSGDVYKEGTAVNKLHKNTEKVPLRKGLRQGCTICPTRFNAGLQEIFKKHHWSNRQIKVENGYTSNYI